MTPRAQPTAAPAESFDAPRATARRRGLTPLAGRLWAVVLTGLPFSVFKVGGGLAAAEDVAVSVGWLFLLWGALDVLLNLGALVRPQHLGYCLLSNVGRLVDRSARGRSFEQEAANGSAASPRYERIGLALDTLLAFAIVATMIWFGRVSTLSPMVQAIWELSVIANILGVGIERVWRSWRGD